jgi:hypothetical protein
MVALGGTGYAAFDLPNHSIAPVKLNPHYIGGYVRAWASVAANGRVLASGGRPTVKLHEPPAPPGDFDVFWHAKPSSGCVALADVDVRGVGSSAAPVAGYASPETTRRPGQAEVTTVLTYNAQGQVAALPFDVALLCSTP